MTMPLAAVQPDLARARTEVFDSSTRVLPTEPGPLPQDLEDAAYSERLRRGVLTGSLLALVAIGIGLAPYVTASLVLCLAWVLRAGSLAGTGHLDRQVRRGRKWYDVLVLPLSYPWFFVVATPGLGLLAFWSFGLAVAAALVAFALAAAVETTLTVAGAVLGASLWWGPGGSRFRGPLRRMVTATSHRPWVWALVTVAVLVAAGAAGYVLGRQGVQWAPATGGPLAADSFLRALF